MNDSNSEATLDRFASILDRGDNPEYLLPEDRAANCRNLLRRLPSGRAGYDLQPLDRERASRLREIYVQRSGWAKGEDGAETEMSSQLALLAELFGDVGRFADPVFGYFNTPNAYYLVLADLGRETIEWIFIGDSQVAPE